MDDGVRVALLGPMEMATAHGMVPVGGVKLQSLLAMLALATPHVVADDHLVEQLWGDEQPANPANALQALVSHLRRSLGRDVVARHGNGYVLRLDPDAVDALRLEHLVRRAGDEAGAGRSGPAAELYRAAVDLVRGPPLGELADAWFARDATPRLDELVAAAHEGLVEAELALGRHADLLPVLVDLVRRHPLRERFRAQLIIALYRAGRQADALDVAREARRYLLEELGLDPSPELQGLERAVLAHDPALAAPIALAPLSPATPSWPTPLTTFVGRVTELAAVAELVDQDRLTTIVGPGGVGKTRLVVELVRQWAEREEVWYVELARLSTPAAVVEAVATTVGAPERAPVDGRPAPTAEHRAIERLGGRPAVVVLDNCEHLVAGVAACTRALLAGCPRVRVIATSREPLGVDGERQFTLPPLPAADAAALFVDRARSVEPRFATNGDDDVLADLCRRLDGLPLAIELAAARTKTLPVAEIAERLDDRFTLLRRSGPHGESRHDGLEATIDWSYDLLFDAERRTLRRFAVFAGGATLDAVESVCGPDALELVSRLVDRSLLVADTSGPTARYRMLESVRAYGLARLREAGEQADARAAHLRWCIDLAERADDELRGRDQLVWLTRLDDEHDNLRSALAVAVEDDPAGALRLVGALVRGWWYRGRLQEGRDWIERALAAGRNAAPEVRAVVLAPAGLLAEPPPPAVASQRGVGDELHHELDVAEERQREALAIRLAGGDERQTARARLLLLATLARRASAGEPVRRAEIDELVAEGRRVFDELGDDTESALIRITEGILAVIFGDLDRATTAADEADRFARRTGDRFTASRAAYVRGMVADVRGDAEEAYRQIEHGLRLFDELGIHRAVTAQARLLAPLADRCGEPELAAQWRAFVRERGEGWTYFDGSAVAAGRNHDGLAARAAGELDRAAEDHADAQAWYRAAGILSGVAFSASCLGFLAAARGQRDDATSHHLDALAAAVDGGDDEALALALEGRAGTVASADDAALLLGAAGAVRRAGLRSPDTAALDPSLAADVAAVVTAVRAELGDPAFAAAIEAGVALGRRRAVELARTAA